MTDMPFAGILFRLIGGWATLFGPWPVLISLSAYAQRSNYGNWRMSMAELWVQRLATQPSPSAT